MTDTDFVVRLPKENTFPIGHDTVTILARRTEQSLIELLTDPKHFLSRLDENGHDLLIHSLAKKLDTEHHWRVIDFLFELPPFYRTIQDTDKNSVLHYLAQQGVDVLRHGNVEDMVYRNKFGNTPLHRLAMFPKFHERISVLPFHTLSVKNGMGLSVLDVMEKVKQSVQAEAEHRSVVASTEVLASLPLNYKLKTDNGSLADFTFGFEFEFCSSFKHEYFAEILHLANQPVGVVSDEYDAHTGKGFDAWHVTGDLTIECDSFEDYAIELVSPVFTIDQIGPMLNLVWRILNDTNSYTNDSCGLHINLGHKKNGLASSNFNPIKMALFLGDDKILKSMDRELSLSCQPFLSYVRGVVHADLKKGVKHIIGPMEMPATPEKMQHHRTGRAVPIDFDAVTLVDKIADDPMTRMRLTNTDDKDVSINLTKLRSGKSETPILEYRATGNSWSDKSPRVFEGIARRLAASAAVAMDKNEAVPTYRALIARDIIHGKTPEAHSFLSEADLKELRMISMA